MSKVKVGRATEQEALVSAYIEDARGVIEDPEAGEASLVKAAETGTALLDSVSKVTVEAINETTKVVHRKNAASRDPHCSAGKIRRLEKTVEALEVEHEQLKATYARLSEFMGEVQVRLRQKREESEEPTSFRWADTGSDARLDAPTGLASPSEPKPSLWQRIFGG